MNKPNVSTRSGGDGRLKLISPAWERLFGYTADELVPRQLTKLVQLEDLTNAV